MGRGSSGSGANLGNGGGGVNPNNIKEERDLVSQRERQREEVDDVLSVARDVMNDYGVDVGQFFISTLGGADAFTAMAYSDGDNIGFNKNFFDANRMLKAYDECVKSGFHPNLGNKTAIQAVASHEYGHVLTQRAAEKLGISGVNVMDQAAKTIVDRARATTSHKGSVSMAKKISGYAGHSNAECIAEAVADVYCNGRNASAESRAVVRVLNDILK